MILTAVFFIMQIFDNFVFCPDLSWEDSERNDLIEFINDSYTAKLEIYLKIGKNVDDTPRNYITQIVQKYWDCFCKVLKGCFHSDDLDK